jgi:hypothetical protein
MRMLIGHLQTAAAWAISGAVPWAASAGTT